MALDIIGRYSKSEVYAFRNATMVVECLGGQYRIVKNRNGPCPNTLVSWAWIEGQLRSGDLLRIAKRKNEESPDEKTCSKRQRSRNRPG